jgi:hypothetical protein
MTKRRYSPAEIISNLREAEVLLSQGKMVMEVLIELWRIEYNTIKLHRFLRY